MKTNTRKRREAREGSISRTGKIPVNYQPKENLERSIKFLERILENFKKAKGLIDIDLEFVPTPNGTRILRGNLIYEVEPGSDDRGSKNDEIKHVAIQKLTEAINLLNNGMKSSTIIHKIKIAKKLLE